MAIDLRRRFPSAAWIDETARVFGNVSIGEGSSLWPYVVIRAEAMEVRIGRHTNLQDHVMVHIGYTTPTIIGDNCSITHRVVLHGCTIEDNCLIGIGATIMDGAVIGAGSIVAGHSFVREGQIIPPHSIVMGTPAKVARQADNTVANKLNAWLYHRNALGYALGNVRTWEGEAFAADLHRERARLEAEHAAAGKPRSNA